MVEEKPRIQKVLAHLYDAEGTVRPKEIAESISDTPLNIGKDLHTLKERGLAESEGEGQWKITKAGREWLESGGTKETGRKDEKKETAETVPTQADLFRAEGERIGFGSRKGDIKLDAVVTYVERIANLDNLTSVWNALTEMGVANDVKKRWVKLYAQNLPGKEIPEELKEKLESGLEAEKLKVEAGDIAPKPKRFSVIGDEIMGDPEGDLSFKEAVQYLAQKKGASPADAESLALQLSKQGPEMLTSIVGLITPLLPKGSSEEGTTLIQGLQQRIEQLADDKHKAEMESLRTEIRSGQRPPEADQQILALSQQLETLREEMRDQQLARIQEQNQAMINALNTKIEQLATGLQGKQADSKLGLMSEVVQAAKEELSGVRADIKGMAPTFLGRGSPAKPRTAGEKTSFGAGLEKGIKKAQEAAALEEDLFFKPTPS